MKEWITIGLLFLNASLLAFLSGCIAVLVVVLIAIAPQIKQSSDDFHDVSQKAEPAFVLAQNANDNLQGLVKAIKEWKLFQDQQRR